MTPNQKIYYLMGLQDAVNEIQLEIKSSQGMTGEAGIAYRYTCRVCESLIEELIEGLKNNL
jgi:hypothetical protein